MQKRLIALAMTMFFFFISPIYAAQTLFTPTIILSEEYTDNLYLDYQNEEEDFITAAGLALNGQMLWRTAGLELTYTPTYNSFKKNDDLNYWRHQADLNMWKEFARGTRLELRDTYLRTNDPSDESPVFEVDGRPQAPAIGADRNRRGRNEHYANVAESRITHQFGVNDRVYAAYRYSIQREVDTIAGGISDDNDISTPSAGLSYDFTQSVGLELDSSYAMSDYKEQNDRNEFNGNARLLYRLNRALSCFLNYQHTILDYDQDIDEDYKIYEPSVGIRYDFQDNARIQVAVGYYIQDFETSDDDEGTNVTSDIYKRWNYALGYVNISGGSGYVIDDNESADNGLNIYYQGRIEAGRNFTPRLAGNVYCGYRYDDYPNEIPDRTQKTLDTGLGLNWQALQWMVIGLSYNYSDVRSDLEVDEYTENSALLTIRIAPTTPYRLN